jgi:hypothetical protein
MAIIETKYDVGDVVYKGDSTFEEQRVECPDCLGKKIVHITFADNRIEELPCYTCETWGLGRYSKGYLEYKKWVPRVRKGIISSIEFKDGKASYRTNYGWEFYEGRSYEAIYNDKESRIHPTEEEALVDAMSELERQNAIELDDLTKKKGSFAKKLQESHLKIKRQDALHAEQDVKRWLSIIKGINK